MKSKTYLFLAVALVAAALAAGCKSGGFRDDPLLRMSSEEALEEGKAYMSQGKYLRAVPLLTHAFEVAPNSREGREALLLAADALYLKGGTENYVKCEAKYRDFLNRFPTSERADYVQFQVANCLSQRMERADRDQTVTIQALEAYQELMRLYPTSSYAAEARLELDRVLNQLAEHEYLVGHFYLRIRNCNGAIQRFEYLQENYPQYEEMDKILLEVGLAYDMCSRIEDADAAYDDLRQKYPQSPHLDKLEKKRRKILKQRKKYQDRVAKRRGGRQGGDRGGDDGDDKAEEADDAEADDAEADDAEAGDGKGEGDEDAASAEEGGGR